MKQYTAPCTVVISVQPQLTLLVGSNNNTLTIVPGGEAQTIAW